MVKYIEPVLMLISILFIVAVITALYKVIRNNK
jgi:hypothetical protein